jgi:hypothetical protein
MSPTSCRCSTPRLRRELYPGRAIPSIRAYHRRVLSPLLIGTFLVAGALALLPVARLRAAGWPTSFLAAYWVALVALGLLLVVARAGFRILVPLLVVGYVAPIVIVRVRRRGRRGEILPPGR